VTPIPELPAASRRMRWRAALRALKRLLRDPDDTARAVEVILAIGVRDFERALRRFAATGAGRALLEERPLLTAALSDRPALERMHPDSLGRAYLAYLEATGFCTTGLIELQRETRRRWEQEHGVAPLDPVRAWFADRTGLIHDLSHIVTGYGTDDVGEATLLAFTQGQTGGRANGLLTTGALFEVFRSVGPRWLPYVARAYVRGRRAVSLFGLPWEELLPLRVATVRRLAELEMPEEAHPAGILRGRRLAAGGLELR
jgi:ubiquinone biosynthesis protein COQ4